MHTHRRLVILVVVAVGMTALVTPTNAAGSLGASTSDRWIVFRRYDPEGLSQRLWVSRLDGSRALQLTQDNAYLPSWSPDRSTIVFDYPAGFSEQIATIHPDGTGFTQCTSLPGISEAADYSPDGRHIIFGRYPPNGPVSSLWVMNADCTDPHPLLKTATTFDDGAKYSPDGSQIVFVRYIVQHGWVSTALIVANADGTSPHRITPFKPDAGLDYPNWSPDGAWIAYGVGAWQGDLTKAGVWLIRPDGSNRHLVYQGGRFYGYQPDFSPDGTRILFVCFDRAQQQDDLCVMNADGSDPHRTVRTPDVYEITPAWS